MSHRWHVIPVSENAFRVINLNQLKSIKRKDNNYKPLFSTDSWHIAWNKMKELESKAK